MRKLFLTVSVLITGCATAPPPVIIKPMPAPTQKCINIPGEGCKKISAGNVGGTTLGHHEDDDEIPINAIIKRKD